MHPIGPNYKVCVKILRIRAERRFAAAVTAGPRPHGLQIMVLRRLWLIWGFLLTVPALSAHAEERVSDDFPKVLLERTDQRHVSLTLENDLFGKGTAQNYTNGIRVGWFDAGRKPPGITKRLERFMPYLDVNDTTSVTYSLGHNLYTPDDVASPDQDPDDRPWAPLAYSSMGMVTLDDGHLDEYEITLGAVGPLALGEPIQKTVHDIVGSPEPRGGTIS